MNSIENMDGFSPYFHPIWYYLFVFWWMTQSSNVNTYFCFVYFIIFLPPINVDCKAICTSHKNQYCKFTTKIITRKIHKINKKDLRIETRSELAKKQKSKKKWEESGIKNFLNACWDCAMQQHLDRNQFWAYLVVSLYNL
jgi:hypothetical protein